MSPAPDQRHVWPEAARDSPWLDQVGPLGAAYWKAQGASLWQADPAHAAGGSPRVGDRVGESIPALASAACAAAWPSQSLLVCALGAIGKRRQGLFLFGSRPGDGVA